MPHLLDTCVLIDVLQGRSVAVSFCQSINQAAISVVSVQELFAGARDNEITQIEQLVSSVEILPVNSAIARLSGEYLRRYFRSHGMDSNDAFIAATTCIH